MSIVHLIDKQADRQVAIIELLAAALERAQNGEIDGIAIVETLGEDPKVDFQFATWLQAKGATAHLQFEVFKQASE